MTASPAEVSTAGGPPRGPSPDTTLSTPETASTAAGAPSSAVPAEQVVELAALVTVLRHLPADVTHRDVVDRLYETGSAQQLWRELRQPAAPTLPGLDLDDMPRAPGVAGGNPVQLAIADVQRWQAAGIRVLSVLDEDYPARLLAVREAPPLLFTRGHLDPADVGVSVVGSREASETGRDLAGEIARALVEVGFSVVSGLAAGVDAVAHRAALAAGGRTVAVLGHGLDRVYPREHAGLMAQIPAAGGFLVSQFFPEAGPTRSSFPIRNATMSGYGVASVIVEATERSGTRHQVQAALAHGRAVILTEAVAAGTSWGREATGHRRVYVASHPEDVIAAVREVRDGEQALVDEVESLLTASQ